MDGETAEDSENSELVKTDDVKVLQAKILQLEQQETLLRKEKAELEEDFGQKRAKFRDIYVQKEEELSQIKALLEDKTIIEEEHEKLKRELDDARSMICIAECQKEQEIEAERRKCQDQIASMQRIMKDAVDTTEHYEKEMTKIQQYTEKLEEELQEQKNQSGHDREGVFSTVTKSLKQKVGGLTGPNSLLGITGESTENLEESMRKAQEDAEMLRSLVVPLEEEIKVLKDKLRSTDEQVQMYEKAFSGLVNGLGSNPFAEVVSGKTPTEVIEHLDETYGSLSQGLQAEKASRSDLEMYVAVLNTQKTVMQDDMDRMKKQLEEVCSLLEMEKREHSALKQTWQMANDQFLESQRLQIMDLRRMQSVLTKEQQRQIWEMKKKEEQKQFTKERITKSKATNQTQVHQQLERKEKPALLTPQPRRKVSSNRNDELARTYYGDTFLARSAPENLSWSGLDSHVIGTPSTPKTSLSSESPLHRKLQRSHSATDVIEVTAEIEVRGTLANSENAESHSLAGFDCSSPMKKPIHSLTKDQFNALSDLTPELEARSNLLEGARASYDSLSMLGKRLVSEFEWQLLEEELTKAREKLSEPCAMCHNYELQLQQLQKEDHEKVAKQNQLQRALERYKQDIQKEQTFRKELESKYSNSSEDWEKQVLEMFKKVEDSEKLFHVVKADFSSCETQVFDELKRLSMQHEQLKQQLTFLQEENNVLVGKYIRRAEELQSETIDLPNTTEDMQFKYLQQREEFIITAEQKEQAQSELVFLREQYEAEKSTRDATELELQRELDMYKREAAVHIAVRTDLENERKLVLDFKKRLNKYKEELQQSGARYQQVSSDFQKEKAELETQKRKKTFPMKKKC